MNLAGVIGKQIGAANIEDIEDDDWEFVMGVNLGGVLNCMRAEIKAMGNPMESGKGKGASIVNAASIAGIMGCMYSLEKLITYFEGLVQLWSVLVCSWNR